MRGGVRGGVRGGESGYLGDGKLKVLLSDMDPSLAESVHPRLRTHALNTQRHALSEHRHTSQYTQTHALDTRHSTHRHTP